MRPLLTIMILLFSHTLLGQTKSLSNVVNSNGDTSFWYKYQNIVIKTLSLTRLDTSSLLYHFRVWKTNQVLDVWQTSNNSFIGQLTSWVTERTPMEEKATGRILTTKRILQSDTVTQIIKLIKDSKIANLPTDDSIKGWKNGFDGITYITEFSSRCNYAFKAYWTPKAQDTTLAEAKFIQHFIDDIFELANSKKIWSIFEKSIPYECYNLGELVACKVVTKKERKKYAKERKNYRQHCIAKIGA